MTVERAAEILDPEHREHYESIEPVNEACRMGMEALSDPLLFFIKKEIESIAGESSDERKEDAANELAGSYASRIRKSICEQMTAALPEH
jgi:hypothetical protein